MKTNLRTKGKLILGLATVLMLISSCSNNLGQMQAKIDALETELQAYKDAEALTQERLKIFDTLDFDYYTN